jgi:hypothetical protein
VRIPSRSLFKNIKQASQKLDKINQTKLESENFHHEYSIRPDTYAFKVDASNEVSKSLTTKTSKESSWSEKSHPLQKKNEDYHHFNLIEFIYRYTTNYPFGTKSPQQVFNQYPMTNLEKLGRLKHRPSKCKMLVSDFIEDSLYNPNYGYFSKEVEIFHSDEPFDYNNIRDIDGFMDSWQKAYSKYDEINPKIKETKQQFSDIINNSEQESLSKSKFVQRAKSIQKQDAMVNTGNFNTRKSIQLWHTPTELFQPYYGEAIARYMLVNYKLNGAYPYEDLIIYEMGGGNGTLMCNILNYIKTNQPDVYARTKYKIIEISSQLAEKQFESALNSKLISQGLDATKLEIINKSIFKWNKVIDKPCFFIALEVFDNFAHDLIRYDNNTGEPLEGQVLVDEHGDFYEFFTPQLSYYSNAFLQLREHGEHSVLNASNTTSGKFETIKSTVPFMNHDKIHPLLHSSSKLKFKNSLLPFKDNMTSGEFIPTRLLQFFNILKHKFPQHSLISSDFHYLPNAVNGYYNSPVVQTILQDKMVDVSTYMTYQGYFDIMFPTDFGLASDLYKQVTNKVPRVESHREFLEQWANTEITTTKAGENPMLDFYTNVSFMVS